MNNLEKEIKGIVQQLQFLQTPLSVHGFLLTIGSMVRGNRDPITSYSASFQNTPIIT